MIRSLEELAFNAWPSLQTLLYDGWVLRFADGYTKRANSVNPLYYSGTDVAQKIETCEKLYRGQGLKVVFKMTPVSQPEGLDSFLAAQGYQVDSPTSVQLLDLSAWNQPTTTPDAVYCESLPKNGFPPFVSWAAWIRNTS
jgi:hypothetical protein